MEPFEIMVSESQERMLCVVRARRASTRCSRSARSGRSTARRSARSPTRGRMRVLRGGEVVGDMPVAALVDDCPLYDLAPERPRRRRCTRAPPATLAPGATLRETLLALLASPNIASRRPLFEQYDCARAVAAPCAGPSEADAAVLALPDGGAHRACRSTATAAASPPTRTRGTVEAVLECAANLACVGAEPLGTDEQPELRQPREAAHRLAAHRGRARPRRRLPRARRADRRRQRLALQRGRRRADLPDAGRRHGRRAARRRARRAARASPREGDAIALVGLVPRPSLRGLRAGQAARRAAARRPARGRRRRTSSRVAGRGPRRGARRATLASAHDVAEGGLLVAARRVLPGGRHRRDARARRGRRPARRAALRRGRRRLRRLRAARGARARSASASRSTSSARVGGDALVLDEGAGAALVARRARADAHGALAPLFP